jgi:formylglycine-generating enzyme required for sulfatase activity/tRNA A-37 threonylcarbamoyl transferase component Bud32
MGSYYFFFDLLCGAEMENDREDSLSNEKTQVNAHRSELDSTSPSSLGDSQTQIGELVVDGEDLNDGLELTDLTARYTVVKRLGQGGMGEVLLANDNRLKRQVAIKRIRGEQARSRSALQRFLTEAQAIAALNHPNVVQVYDYGRDQEGPFLIMEYVDGQSLLERCRDNPMPMDEAVEITCELLSGLGRAHEQGIIHRDIKPANILLTKEGKPKLTDFGLAKQTTADHGQTVTGAVLGTIDFMPPEQRRDATLVDARSDLWSLAATLYQILTCKSPKVIRLDLLPKNLASTLGQALEEKPAERFQTAAEFRHALRQAMQVSAVPAESDLYAGQCPQCGTRNEANVRFCRECTSPLKVPCLNCGTEIPIWDKGCTDCGTRQVDLLERKRTELQQLRIEVERLREAGKFGESQRLLESVGHLRHPRLLDFAQWLDRTRDELGTEVNRLKELSTRALAEARAHLAAWDYPAAIRAIKSMPSAAITDEHKKLLLKLQADWSEGQQALQTIQHRVKARQLNDLLPVVQRAVQLRGDRDDLKRLLSQLEQREARISVSNASTSSAASRGDSIELTTKPRPSLSLTGNEPKRSLHRRNLPRNAAIFSAAMLTLVVGIWLLFKGREDNSTPRIATTEPPADVNRNENKPNKLEPSGETSESPQLSSAKGSPHLSPAVAESKPQVAVQSPLPSSGVANNPSTNALASTSLSPEVINSIGVRFKLITPGSFQMGENEHAREVTIDNPYFLGVFEVTQQQYERVIGHNPSTFKGEQNPVETVSWEEAVEFCRKLSELPQEKAAGRIYRLPTEAEWEFACRAGTTTAFSFGDDESQLAEFGWFDENSGGQTHPVGHKKPNAWQLYDLHGNVWEWCYEGDTKQSNTGSDLSGRLLRIGRGGSWRGSAAACRSASRRGDSSVDSSDASRHGFRLVLDVPGTPPPLESDSAVAKPAGVSPPPTAAFPFDATEAKSHQQAWSGFLGVPVDTTNGIGMKLALIPPGKFLREEKGQTHEVTLTKPFYMGTFEVTQAKYEQVIGTNPSTFKGADNPIETLSWEDAVEFCHKLSALPQEKAARRVYRLPTEAEWEYACRAGSQGAFSFDLASSRTEDYCWFDGNSAGRAHPVGQKKPNNWGLHDVHGNVWEWCLDWQGDYPNQVTVDPSGPLSGLNRIHRGGSWRNGAEQGRSSHRSWCAMLMQDGSLGFRVVMEVPEASNENVAQSSIASKAEQSVPPSADAPFDLAQSERHQQVWSDHIKRPVEIINSAEMKLRLIPPGKFKMGSKGSEREIVLTRPYYIGACEVTQRQFELVMGTRPSHFKSPQNPVEQVSWLDAMEFCHRLSQAQQEQKAALMYRLPTEAEWEHACRAGTETLYCYGDDESLFREYAWYDRNAGGRTHPVGKKKPNNWGLHDMHGNVWEWCYDWFGDYQGLPSSNPSGLQDGTRRTYRSGGWNADISGCHSAYRDGHKPNAGNNTLGFRVIATLLTDIEPVIGR